jgi:hypothetical protein
MERIERLSWKRGKAGLFKEIMPYPSYLKKENATLSKRESGIV